MGYIIYETNMSPRPPRVTKRKRSPSPPPSPPELYLPPPAQALAPVQAPVPPPPPPVQVHAPVQMPIPLTLEHLASLYQPAFDMYKRFFMILEHEYDPTTGLLLRVKMVRTSTDTDKKIQLSRRIACQMVHVYNRLRTIWMTQAIEFKQRTISFIGPLSRSDHFQRSVLLKFGRVLKEKKIFAATYLYYYLVNFSDYNQSNLPKDTREFFYMISCALNDSTYCDENNLKSSTSNEPFETDHTLLVSTLDILSQHAGVITQTVGVLNHHFDKNIHGTFCEGLTKANIGSNRASTSGGNQMGNATKRRRRHR